MNKPPWKILAEQSVMACQGSGCDAIERAEDIQLYGGIHHRDGRHGITEKPLSVRVLRQMVRNGTFTGEGKLAGLAYLVSLCPSCAAKALAYQNGVSTDPLLIDATKSGLVAAPVQTPQVPTFRRASPIGTGKSPKSRG